MEWRAHTTQIRHIEANAEKHHQEVLTTTNTIEDAIQKNNVIFGEKWETTHDCIDCRSEDIHLLKNRIVGLKALSGLQQNALQTCQSTIAGLEETVLKLAASVTVLEKSVCRCCAWGSSIGKLPTTVFTKQPKRSGMEPPSRLGFSPG